MEGEARGRSVSDRRRPGISSGQFHFWSLTCAGLFCPVTDDGACLPFAIGPNPKCGPRSSQSSEDPGANRSLELLSRTLPRLLRSLLVLGTLVLPETRGGSHSLQYFYTAVTRPGLWEPRFFAVGYVDDQQFVHFDSNSASGRMEPRAAWMEGVGREDPEYWERSTRIIRGEAHVSRENLERLRGYFNQSKSCVHTVQRMSGCEVSPELRFTRGFEQYAYDGKDYLVLDTETYTWMAAVSPAVNTKRKWEAERSIGEGVKAYLEETCVTWVKKYLEMGKDTLQRADPPSARVTLHAAPHGGLTLRCRAWGFYPKDISLSWLRDGQEQLQDTEFIETRPAGDGTFQKWAAVDVTSGQEGEYTCRVQHEGLPEPLTLRWESPSSSIRLTMGFTAAAIVLTAVRAGVLIWRKNSGGKGCDYVQAKSYDSDQGSDVSLTAEA